MILAVPPDISDTWPGIPGRVSYTCWQKSISRYYCNGISEIALTELHGFCDASESAYASCCDLSNCGSHSSQPLEKTQLIVHLEGCFLWSSLPTVSGGLDLNGYDNHLINHYPRSRLYSKRRKGNYSHNQLSPRWTTYSYSDFKKLKCVTAWMLDAEDNRLKTIQHEYYLEEITSLKKKKALKSFSSILTLHPFLHSVGLLHIGGRRRLSDISYDMKHPIILNGKHLVTKLLAWTEHLKACSHWTPNAHSPNPDLIRINPNLLPEVVSIWIELVRAIAPCAWGPKRVWHARSPTVSALLQATHCVPRICSTREAIWWLAEVKIWRGRHGSCVVWSTCTREFGSAQCSVDTNHAIDAHWIRIEFALGNSVTEPVWIWIQCEQAFRLFHAGPTLLAASLTLQYHIVRGRNTIWAITRSCITCQRNAVRPWPQLLGQLPIERITPRSKLVWIMQDRCW